MKLSRLLETLLRMEEQECIDYAATAIESMGYDVNRGVEKSGYIQYVVLTPAENPHAAVGMVAHCDTVATRPPQRFERGNGVIRTEGGGVLGGDDRCGVAAIMELVRRGYRPQVYLTVGEETGGSGARYLAENHTPPKTLHALIQVDRAGPMDFVTYDCDSPDLDAWVGGAGFVKDTGTFSDISILAPRWGLAAANVAAGYVGQHSKSEIVVVPHLAHTIDRVSKLIRKPPAAPLPYIESKRWSWKSTGSYSSWDEYYEARDRAYESTDRTESRPLVTRPRFAEADAVQPKLLTNEYDCICMECEEAVHWTEWNAKWGLCDECKQFLGLE